MNKIFAFLIVLLLSCGILRGQGIYKVTDYYPNPSDPATAVGMVIWVDPQSNGAHGLIVSLDEKEVPHWSFEFAVTGAVDKSNGVVNMQTMTAFIKNSAGKQSWEDYPAFQWCKEKTTGGLLWYLPSNDELMKIYAGYNGMNLGVDIQDWGYNNRMPDFESQAMKDARAAFNKKITAAGGKGFLWHEYWSSSELPEAETYVLSMSFAMGWIQNNHKNWPFRYVRAVAAF